MNTKILRGNTAQRFREVLFLCLFTAYGITALAAVARGQETSAPAGASPISSATTTPTATPTPAGTPIPAAEIVNQAEAVLANLRDIEADLASEQITATVDSELPALEREIDARLDENAKILNSKPSLETLRVLEMEWKALAEKLVVWRRELTARASGLDREITRLTQVDQTVKDP